jgi:hypothetical protein
LGRLLTQTRQTGSSSDLRTKGRINTWHGNAKDETFLVGLSLINPPGQHLPQS